MANIFDVAKYILTMRGEMSTIKLQMLCYYAQAWHLALEGGKPLFGEDFVAWQIGPICKPLYELRKGEFSICAEQIPEEMLSGEELTDKQKDLIDEVLEEYGSDNIQILSTLSRMDRSWQVARVRVPIGVDSDNVIDKNHIAICYHNYLVYLTN